jgi:hypothetical protein
MGGTLLHEVSHFNDLGATDDHAYGASGVARLALLDPNMGVRNADSFEYFFESQPVGGQCLDVEGYLDALGSTCSSWMGYLCPSTANDYGSFTAADKAALRKNCW